MNLKRKLFSQVWKLLKVEEGCYPPEWLLWLFFPLLHYACRYARVRYDPSEGVYYIQGVKVAEFFFRELGKGGMPEGEYFKMLRRESDGMVYIERFVPEKKSESKAMKPWDELADFEKGPYLDKAAESLDGLYYCERAWSAWGVGTMRESDFGVAAEDDNTVADVAKTMYEVAASAVAKGGK